jgi:gliding motility-associated-like protein
MKCSPSNIFNKYIIVLLLLVLPAITCLYAQVTINKPAIGFTQICANSDFNKFEVSFSFSPSGSLDPSNQFILELSDAAGNFATPVTLSATEKPLTATPTSRTLIFSVPTSTGGENYKVRVKSTSPASVSPVSNSFAAYYKIQDSQFSINNFNATATYCAGGSYLLTIDNPGTGTNDSPLKYPSLTYKWFKEPSLVPVATTASLTVNQPGRYYVETNYGTCTSDSYSNRVTVGEGSVVSATITSSKGNPFCPSDGPTTLSTQTGNSYQWFNNDVAISGAIGQQYQTSSAGKYSVKVDFGGCTSTASINLQDVPFTSSLNVSSTTTINEGETKTIIATTDANNPTFEWYFNNTLIPSAVSNTLDVIKEGNYYLIITQTTGCISQKELAFVINFPFVDPNVTKIPNLISPNNDGINDTWILPQEYVSGTNTEILLLNSRGEIALQTNNYQNNWPENALDFKSVNPIYYYIITTQDNKVKKGSITVVK